MNKIGFFQTLYSLPSSGGIFLALTIPGYLLAGIHYPKVQDLNVFYLYIGKALPISFIFFIIIWKFILFVGITQLLFVVKCKSLLLISSLINYSFNVQSTYLLVLSTGTSSFCFSSNSISIFKLNWSKVACFQLVVKNILTLINI